MPTCYRARNLISAEKAPIRQHVSAHILLKDEQNHMALLQIPLQRDPKICYSSTPSEVILPSASCLG